MGNWKKEQFHILDSSNSEKLLKTGAQWKQTMQLEVQRKLWINNASTDPQLGKIEAFKMKLTGNMMFILKTQ